MSSVITAIESNIRPLILLIIFLLPVVAPAIYQWRLKRRNNVKENKKCNHENIRGKYESSNAENIWNNVFYNENNEREIEIENNMDSIRARFVKEYFGMKEYISIYSSIEITPDEVIAIFDNKRIFPFQNGYKCKVTQFGRNYKIDINITYTQGCRIFLVVRDSRLYEKLNGQDEVVYEKITKIYNTIILPQMSDADKELKVHDYLISTSRYDNENFKNGIIPPESYTPYGILYNHIAVCQAYAETFMIFMMLANIECHFVIGTTTSGQYIENQNSLHAWNIVKINKQFVHVDVTFDNPVPYTIGIIDHTYFNVNDEFMKKTHKWNVNHYPNCG